MNLVVAIAIMFFLMVGGGMYTIGVIIDNAQDD